MTTTTSRTCQPCTGCCDGWVQITIDGQDVYPGKPCPHSTGTGCDNYPNRPQDPCVNFTCGWMIPGSPLPEWMKPSNAKVIVLFNKLGWQGHPVDLAVPIGRRIPPRALNWLKQFSQTHGRPLVYTEQQLVDGQYQRQQQLFAHGPVAFQQALMLWQEQGLRLW